MLLLSALRYKSWADGRTLQAVAQINRHNQSPAYDFARQQLNHMIRVEELFRARLTGGVEPHDSQFPARSPRDSQFPARSPRDFANPPELPSLDQLAARIEESNRWLEHYAQTLQVNTLGESDTTERFAQIICFTFVDGRKGSLTRQEVLYHLVNHGTYHRGAIGHALDLAGAPRPADTYTVFIHEAEPHRRKG